jgi:putative cell wall-binding protein
LAIVTIVDRKREREQRGVVGVVLNNNHNNNNNTNRLLLVTFRGANQNRYPIESFDVV